MKKFVTKVEIVDDFGSEVVEVVTELPPNVAAKAEEIYRRHGGHMSHNEIVAAAMAAEPATR